MARYKYENGLYILNFPKKGKVKITDKLLRKAIYKVFGGRCYYTGQKISFEEMRIDHVFPRSKCELAGCSCDELDNLYNYVPTRTRVNNVKSNFVSKVDTIAILEKIAVTFAPKVLKKWQQFLAEEAKPKQKPLCNIRKDCGSVREPFFRLGPAGCEAFAEIFPEIYNTEERFPEIGSIRRLRSDEMVLVEKLKSLLLAGRPGYMSESMSSKEFCTYFGVPDERLAIDVLRSISINMQFHAEYSKGKGRGFSGVQPLPCSFVLNRENQTVEIRSLDPAWMNY